MGPQTVEGAAEADDTVRLDGAAAGGADLVAERALVRIAADDDMKQAE
jgi:hypothetical protein